jgi:hypothetical protein
MRHPTGSPATVLATGTQSRELLAAGSRPNAMNDTHRMLPLLARMSAGVDEIFVEYVGPFGELLIGEARSAWLRSGNKMHSSDIESYIALLAREIDDAARRAQFVLRAHQHAGVAHLNPHS